MATTTTFKTATPSRPRTTTARTTARRSRFAPPSRRAGVWRWVGAVGGAMFAILSYAYLTLPDVRPLAVSNPASTAFMDLRADEAHADGRPAKRVQRWVAYNKISPQMKRAVLVAEDAAFWQHEGVDFVELQKSIETDWEKGRLIRGASTITQQLAKNLYLSPTRSPLRKIRELVIARRLEAELTKTRILELYLNVIEWGDGIYGVEAAAREYFQTSAAGLGPQEAALLAAAIINPRVLNPAKPTARLKRRQQLILRRMGAASAIATHGGDRRLHDSRDISRGGRDLSNPSRSERDYGDPDLGKPDVGDL